MMFQCCFNSLLFLSTCIWLLHLSALSLVWLNSMGPTAHPPALLLHVAWSWHERPLWEQVVLYCVHPGCFLPTPLCLHNAGTFWSLEHEPEQQAHTTLTLAPRLFGQKFMRAANKEHIYIIYFGRILPWFCDLSAPWRNMFCWGPKRAFQIVTLEKGGPA